MRIATVSSKMQVTFPKDLLLLYGMKPKGRVLLEEDKKGLLVKPLKKSIVAQTGGSLADSISSAKLGKTFRQIMKETKKVTASKLVKS